MFMKDVITAQALPARQLRLTFSDGCVGVVSVDTIVGDYTGVFAPLCEPTFFALAQVDAELGTVVWPNGADLCPDVLYAHATNQQGLLVEAEHGIYWP